MLSINPYLSSMPQLNYLVLLNRGQCNTVYQSQNHLYNFNFQNLSFSLEGTRKCETVPFIFQPHWNGFTCTCAFFWKLFCQSYQSSSICFYWINYNTTPFGTTHYWLNRIQCLEYFNTTQPPPYLSLTLQYKLQLLVY